MKYRANLLLLILITIATSCAKIYYSSDAFALAREHKKIAIIPPNVAIAASRRIDAESLKEQQKTESKNFQKEIYSWMLRRRGQGKIYVDIQDVETTNAKLKKAGYPESPLTPSELCSVLEVDGIMTSNFSMSKPVSEAGAIALAFLAGIGSSTNSITATLEVHDAKTQKMIWNYNHKYSGGIGSTPTGIVDALMRKASKKMPYVLKNQ
jgi:hypothetical protein